MTAWLDRRERILLHDKFVTRQLARLENPHLPVLPAPPPRQPPLVYPQRLKLAVRPSAFGISFEDLKTQYGAHDFPGAFSRFILHLRQPELSKRQIYAAAAGLQIPFHKVSVYHRIKFVTNDPFSRTPTADVVVDSIHCEPSFKDKYSKDVPGRFDTALINYRNGNTRGVKGMLLSFSHGAKSKRLINVYARTCCWPRLFCLQRARQCKIVVWRRVLHQPAPTSSVRRMVHTI